MTGGSHLWTALAEVGRTQRPRMQGPLNPVPEHMLRADSVTVMRRSRQAGMAASPVPVEPVVHSPDACAASSTDSTHRSSKPAGALRPPGTSITPPVGFTRQPTAAAPLRGVAAARQIRLLHSLAWLEHR